MVVANPLGEMSVTWFSCNYLRYQAHLVLADMPDKRPSIDSFVSEIYCSRRPSCRCCPQCYKCSDSTFVHRQCARIVVSQTPQVIVSFPPEDVATRVFASPVSSPYNQSHICQQPFTSPVTCFRIYPLNGKKRSRNNDNDG